MDIGFAKFSRVIQPSVSRCLHNFIDIFNRPEIFGEYVKFFGNVEELRRSRNRYFLF